MTISASKEAREKAQSGPRTAESLILPTMLGEGYGTYEVRPTNFVLSIVIHMLAFAGFFAASHLLISNKEMVKAKVTDLVNAADIILPPALTISGGGGGGGDRSKLDASAGKPPKFDLDQITPPAAVIRNDKPLLVVQQTIAVPPEVILPQSNVQVGDPLSAALIASNGTGAGSGIGTGRGGGVGKGDGRGLGVGFGAGTGDGVFRVGGGVSAPRPIYNPDPEYSEEARKAKYQGTVVLAIVIGTDGKPRDVRVQRSLGLGLDEKAMEAVRTWRFEPARKNGQPVPVAVNIEVNFNLY